MSLTVVPVLGCFIESSAPHRVGQDTPGMETDDLHLLRVGVIGDELHQQRARIFGQGISGDATAFGRAVVDAASRDVDEELLKLFRWVSMKEKS